MATGRDAAAQRSTAGAPEGLGGGAVDVGLTYQVPAGCPSRDVIIQQLAARGLHVTAAGADRRLTIAVALGTADAPRFSGKLTVEGSPQQRAPSQTVNGQDCRAVTLSLALVAALALIPVADAAAENPPAGAIAVSPPETNVGGGRPVWFVGAVGRGMTGLGDGPALGFGAFAERVWGDKPEATASLIFSVATAAPPTITVPSGSADLRAYLGRLEGCWFGGLIAARTIFLSPCAGMEGGVLRGTGSINQPRTATRPWVAPVFSVRGAVGLTRGVWLSFGGAAFTPLVRDTFVFDDPRATIHRSPAVGGLLELGLAGAFR